MGMREKKAVIGVDVGTLSVRAGLFLTDGKLLAHASAPLDLNRPKPDFVEQSSDQIWEATGQAVREAVLQAQVAPQDVVGLSYDATCSLVALDRAGKPLSVSPTGEERWNVVVWMDHRAVSQAERINDGRYSVLQYVGGRISPEMEPPKLLWIKENFPDRWKEAGKFFDLADFMVYRSTGNDVRSLCTVVCKWLYLGHEARWDQTFYQRIGLEDLLDGSKVSEHVRSMGTFAGYLTEQAAADLRLTTETAVSVGIIDAHAGGIGVLGSLWEDEGVEGTPLDLLETAVALIGGTSSCHMAVSREPHFVPGVWGPYYGAMIPGMWLTEGGQSATGGLLDYVIIDSHLYPQLEQMAKDRDETVYQILNEQLQTMAADRPIWLLTKDFHILDYHHGNRSPHADPRARGVVDGLTLDLSIESLASRYYATIQAVAYGTREIIETMNQYGHRVSKIYATGGGTKNPVWLQEHADITQCEIRLAREAEAVLLGTAILAAVGAGVYRSIPEAMRAMCHSEGTILPRSESFPFHQVKYEIYKEMYQQHLRRRERMSQFG